MTAVAAAAEDGAMNQGQQVLTNSAADSHGLPRQQHPRSTTQRKRSLPLRIGRGLMGLLGVLVVLGLSGALYESVAEAADARAYAPPGQMVDVGGYRLHINCVGTGSPTVVIEAGWGDWSPAWSSVQSAAAQHTRVCTYDRAGYGFSEPGPRPRTADRYARELHTLLHNAGIPGPYVLAGHSMGGLTVRLFAHEYAADVAGVVLIDSMSPNSAKPSADAPSTSESSDDWILRLPARIGLLRLVARPLGLIATVPPEFADAYAAASVTPRYVQAYFLDEGRGMPASLAEAGRVTTFGDVPLIVLSRGLDQEPQWMADQAEMLQLSSNSQQLFAARSGHNIEFDDPQAAVGAIAQMVAQVRGE